MPSCVWLTSPPGQRRTVEQADTAPFSRNVALPYPGSSLLAVVEARQERRWPQPSGEHHRPPASGGEPVAVKVDTVKSSWGACPSVRPGVGRGYCNPKGTILFFLALAVQRSRPPLLVWAC